MNDIDRSAVSVRVMKSISRLLARRDIFPIRREDGTAPIVITLPDDTIGEVSQWVKETGGCANVILADRNGFSISVWDDDALPTDDAIDLYAHTNMAMLRAWTGIKPDGIASFNVIASVAQAKELAYQF